MLPANSGSKLLSYETSNITQNNHVPMPAKSKRRINIPCLALCMMHEGPLNVFRSPAVTVMSHPRQGSPYQLQLQADCMATS